MKDIRERTKLTINRPTMRPMPAGEERTMCPKKATRVVLSRPISSRSLHLYVLFLSSIALLANNLPRSPTLPFRCRRYVLTETSTKKKIHSLSCLSCDASRPCSRKPQSCASSWGVSSSKSVRGRSTRHRTGPRLCC